MDDAGKSRMDDAGNHPHLQLLLDMQLRSLLQVALCFAFSQTSREAALHEEMWVGDVKILGRFHSPYTLVQS